MLEELVVNMNIYVLLYAYNIKVVARGPNMLLFYYEPWNMEEPFLDNLMQLAENLNYFQ